MPAEEIIAIRNLAKRFGDRRILEDVSFSVRKGETVVVLGRSGTGKSVLLKTLIGLLEPDAGEATILGRNMALLSESERLRERRRVGYVFQAGALFDSLSVLENVGFTLFEERVPVDKIRQRVESRLRMVGLAHTIDMLPSELSGGMQKRISLARALIDLPQVVLYDEPTSGLDPLTTDVINQIILRLRSAFEVTSIVVTHDIKSGFTIADRVIMLDQGRIVAQGTPAEIQGSALPWVQHFVAGHALDSESIDTGMFSLGPPTHAISGGLTTGPFKARESGPQVAQTGSLRFGAIRNRTRKPPRTRKPGSKP